MNKHAQVTDILKKEILRRFPLWDPPSETIAAYAESLIDIELDLLQAACAHAAATTDTYGKNAPSIFKIRESAVKILCQANSIPTSAEAWQQINRPRPIEHSIHCEEDSEIRESILAGAISYWVGIESLHKHEESCTICRIETSSPLSHSFVEHVAALVGWPDRFFTDNQAADRSQFIRIYDAQLDRMLEKAIMLPEVRAFIENHKNSPLLPVGDHIKILTSKFTK